MVFLFFAQAQRAWVSSGFVLVHQALVPEFRFGGALLALLPLVPLLIPLAPVARWMGRRGAVAVAVAGAAIFRLPMVHPALETRLVAGAMVVAFFALYLTTAVGLLERRQMAAGAILGLVADQLLRMGGTGYDLSFRPGWLPIQVVLSLAALAGAVVWARRGPTPEPGDAEAGHHLERRTGGYRLRSALLAGPILFLDLHVLGVPPVASRWTGVAYEVAALAAAAAAAIALGLAMAGAGAPGRRTTVLGLVTASLLGALTAWWGSGMLPLVLMAVGHAAALLLIARTLDPARGRRSGAAVATGLSVFVALLALFSVALFPASAVGAASGAVPWVLLLAGAVAAASGALLPHRGPEERLFHPIASAAAGGAVLVAAGLLLAVVVPPAQVDQAGARQVPPAREPEIDARYGFARDWRFEPSHVMVELRTTAGRAARILRMPAGAPFVYNVDLALWLERHGDGEVDLLEGDKELLGTARVSGRDL